MTNYHCRNVKYLEKVSAGKLSASTQQLHAVCALVLFVRIRKLVSDILVVRSGQYSIANRVRQNVGIGMPYQFFVKRYCYSAQNYAATLPERVNVEARANLKLGAIAPVGNFTVGKFTPVKLNFAVLFEKQRTLVGIVILRCGLERGHKHLIIVALRSLDTNYAFSIQRSALV